ncbi:condensin-2 complex subunit D3 [Trichonephila clavipes]|nr:condensin-2 complex subunit D3 [Trichonephila clavipes]
MKLEKLFGSDADELIWFYLSMYAAFCKLPPKMCEHAVEEFQKEENWENWTFMENVLKVIKWTFSDLHPERLENVINMLKGKIEDFVAPVEIAPLMIEILSKIEKHLGRSDTFAQFGEKMVKIAMNTLTPFISRKKSHKMPTEDIAIESLILIREFCHLFPRYITTNLTVLLKSFVYTRNGLNSKQISVELRAHAFAALGKLSLQHETLGRELLPVLAKELMTSKEDMLRNNAYLILIEMCKRYTSHADKYIPIINMCFRDRRYIVRFQSITLLVSLLQEEFIKSKGTLLYCLLATVIDKIEEIQELGKYCLCSLLYEKKKTIFADHFLDAIYVFNNYPPPDNERVSQIVRELKKFAIMYDGNREKRMQIYKFMLNCMEPSSRAYVVNTICQDILTSVAEAVFPINRVTSSVVRDCFAVLNSKEIRAFNTDQMSSEFEDGEEEQAVKAELELRKVVLVQPVIPVLISLKNCIMEKKSDLLEDLVQFLKDILADYKHEINELLAEDTMLRMQVQLELRNESNLLEKEAKEKKKENNAKKPTSQSSKGKLAEQIMEVSAYLIQKNRDSFCPNENKEGTGEPKDVTLRNILQTPRNKSTASKIDYEDINLNENDIKQLSTSGAQSARRTNVKEAIFSSTPHVLLKPLKFKSPNVSRISVSMDDIDLDSD